MNTISSRSCHSRPGLSGSRCEAFLCFGVSALICYHLQITPYLCRYHDLKGILSETLEHDMSSKTKNLITTSDAPIH